MARYIYRFRAEKLSNYPVRNNKYPFIVKHKGGLWGFNLSQLTWPELSQASYDVLKKAVRLAPEERGFELLISDADITLTPYSQKQPKQSAESAFFQEIRRRLEERDSTPSRLMRHPYFKVQSEAKYFHYQSYMHPKLPPKKQS